MDTISSQIWAMEHRALLELSKKMDKGFLATAAEVAKLPFAMLNKSRCSTWVVSAAELGAEAASDTAAKPRKNGATSYTIRVIPIEGTLVRKSSWYDEYLGFASTEKIKGLFQEALADGNISAIVLSFNTNGGVVEGTEELATLVKNSSKPVVAFVNSKAHSAGYWVASQTSKIFLAETTAMVGSIGTMTSHVDASVYYGLIGQKWTYITSDGSEDKNFPPNNAPLTDDGIAALKAVLNPLNAVFVSAVQTARPAVSKEALTGKIYSAVDAIALGLADAVGNLDAAITQAAKLVSQQSNSQQSNSQKMAKELEEGQSLAWFQTKLDAQDTLLAKLQASLDEALKNDKTTALQTALDAANAKVIALEAEKTTLATQLATATKNLENTAEFSPIAPKTGGDVGTETPPVAKVWEQAAHNQEMIARRAANQSKNLN